MMSKEIFMNELKPGMSGVVASLDHVGGMGHRMLDLGLVEGSKVTCLGKSFWGDPAAYEICGAVIALRNSDCARVLLREINE